MPLDKQQVLDILRDHEAELHRSGIKRAGLFGSIARGDGDNDSDIDILIELAPDPLRTSFGYVGIKHSVAALFPGRVDVVDKNRIKSDICAPIDADVIYAF